MTITTEEAPPAPALDLRLMLNLRECPAYVGLSSVTAFYRWKAQWGLRAWRHGQYKRSEVDSAMKREGEWRTKKGRK